MRHAWTPPAALDCFAALAMTGREGVSPLSHDFPHPEVPRSGLEGALQKSRDPWRPPSRPTVRVATSGWGEGWIGV